MISAIIYLISGISLEVYVGAIISIVIIKSGIELRVNAKNKKAYEMYKDYGFSEKSINMKLK